MGEFPQTLSSATAKFKEPFIQEQEGANLVLIGATS